MWGGGRCEELYTWRHLQTSKFGTVKRQTKEASEEIHDPSMQSRRRKVRSWFDNTVGAWSNFCFMVFWFCLFYSWSVQIRSCYCYCSCIYIKLLGEDFCFVGYPFFWGYWWVSRNLVFIAPSVVFGGKTSVAHAIRSQFEFEVWYILHVGSTGLHGCAKESRKESQKVAPVCLSVSWH